MAKESGEMPMETGDHGKGGPFGGLDPAELLRQGAAPDTLSDGRGPLELPAMEELVPLFPRFEILELIGKGGMGAVYKVRQPELDRIVALKILPPAIGKDEAFSDRFTREARALAKLNHPGIVTLHEFGRGGDLYFILMEYVDGVNLRQLLANGRLYPREALAIVPQICDALQYAHDRGIVHRDIKPENILLDRLGRVKVADFGLAKLAAEEAVTGQDGSGTGKSFMTEAGKVMGTPRYMAPEQEAHPAEVDHRADIYALGVVFYQMLTGELPDEGLPAPSRKVRVDVRLDEIVLRALERNPEMRFQQASAMKTMVEDLDAPQALSPRPASAEMWGLDYRSKATLFGRPWLHVATGMDPATGRAKVARGIVAIGGKASGVLAVGGNATGIFAFGGTAVGVFAFGGVALGVISTGGLAVGPGLAIGGAAIGGVAIGGATIGYYGYGGLAIAVHGMDGVRQDPAAEAFFLPWAEWLVRYMGFLQVLPMAFMLTILLGVPAWISRKLDGRAQAESPRWSPWLRALLIAVVVITIGVTVVLNLKRLEWSRELSRAAEARSSAWTPPVKTAEEDKSSSHEIRLQLQGTGIPVWHGRMISMDELGERLHEAAIKDPSVPVIIEPESITDPGRIGTIHSMVREAGFFHSRVIQAAEPQLRAVAWQHQLDASSGKPWDPAGADLPEGFALPVMPAEMAPPGESRRMCLWFSGLPMDELGVLELKFTDMGGSNTVRTSSGDEIYQPGTRASLVKGPDGWTLATFDVDWSGDLPPESLIEVAYSAGRWTEGERIGARQMEMTSLVSGVTIDAPAQGGDGKSFLVVTWDRTVDKGAYQHDFVAVTRNRRRLQRVLDEAISTEHHVTDMSAAGLASSWAGQVEVGTTIGSGGSGGESIIAKRYVFDVPLAEIDHFEIRSRPVRRFWLPVKLRSDDIQDGRMVISYDPAAEVHPLEGVIGMFCIQYGVNVSFEGQDELLSLPKKKVVVKSVDEFLAVITRDSPYRVIKREKSWVILPKENSVLERPVDLDVTGLSVREAVESLTGGATTDAGGDIPLSVKCPPVVFNATPAWEALSRICEEVCPDSRWRIGGAWIAGSSDGNATHETGKPRIEIVPRNGSDLSVIRNAENWLRKLDHGDPVSAYEATTRYFRRSVNLSLWLQSIETTRSLRGYVVSRKLIAATPAGDRFVMEFSTGYDDKKNVLERVIYVRESDGKWRPEGYNIR